MEKNGNSILLFENLSVEKEEKDNFVRNVILLPIKSSNGKIMAFLQVFDNIKIS